MDGRKTRWISSTSNSRRSSGRTDGRTPVWLSQLLSGNHLFTLIVVAAELYIYSTWITIAMVDRKEHRRVTDRSLILLIKTLSLLGWGRKTWYLVLRDQRGEVLDSEFTRMVNSLKMEFTMQV